MFAVRVIFKVKPGCMVEFLALMREQAKNSLSLEETCRHFDVCTDGEEPDEVFLYELYVDKAAFDHHLGTRHFADFDEASARYVISREIRTYSTVWNLSGL